MWVSSYLPDTSSCFYPQMRPDKAISQDVFPPTLFFLLAENQISQIYCNKIRQPDSHGSSMFSLYYHLKLRVSEMQLNTEFKKNQTKSKLKIKLQKKKKKISQDKQSQIKQLPTIIQVE